MCVLPICIGMIHTAWDNNLSFLCLVFLWQASTVEKIMKNLHLEISNLKRSLDESRYFVVTALANLSLGYYQALFSYFIIAAILSKEACENASCNELHSNEEKKATMEFKQEPRQFK